MRGDDDEGRRGPGLRIAGDRFLRIAFLTGAVADACALLPMLSPRLATLLWGLHDAPGSYRLAMGCCASLMLGWTILLLWASRRPRERRAIAALTVLVIAGLVGAEMWAIQAGVLAAGKVAPTLVLQVALGGLFTAAGCSRRRPVAKYTVSSGA